MRVFTGIDELRQAVGAHLGYSDRHTDSTVRAAVELLSVEEGGGGCRTATRATLELEGSATPACVTEIVSVLVP